MVWFVRSLNSGKYYCCPQIVENVSFACRGSTGRCKKVASRSQRRSQVDTVETSDEFTYSFKLLMTACFLLYLIGDTFCVGRESTDAALATHGDNKEKSQEKDQLSCIGCCFDCSHDFDAANAKKDAKCQEMCQSRVSCCDDYLSDCDIDADWG
jgi:hypothetical protein